MFLQGEQESIFERILQFFFFVTITGEPYMGWYSWQLFKWHSIFIFRGHMVYTISPRMPPFCISAQQNQVEFFFPKNYIDLPYLATTSYVRGWQFYPRDSCGYLCIVVIEFVEQFVWVSKEDRILSIADVLKILSY